MADIILIAALTREYVIGDGPDIPWRNKALYPDGKLPEDYKADMKRFKELTTRSGNNAIIMGRKTYFGKPLPNRKNIVVSSTLQPQEGVVVVPSIEEALQAAQGSDETYCIGGGALYEAMLPLANRMELTWIEQSYPGNVFFPKFNKDEWKETVHKRPETLVTFASYERK